MEKKRYYNIDFLRIILISAIVMHHFIHAMTDKWNTGWIAVEFFFVIAGFIFYLTYNSQKSIIEFAIGKLIRFMPLLVCTSLVLAFSTKFRLDKFLADVFLMQKTGLYIPEGGFGYNHPAWFVAVLFWILLFMFSLRKNFGEQKSNFIIGVLAFFSFIIYVNKTNFLYLDPRIFRGFSPVAVGYFSAVVLKFLQTKITYKVKVSNIATLFELSLISYLFFLMFSFNGMSNKMALIFLMGIVLILFGLQKGYLSLFLNKKIFGKISTYVFPVFMTHSILYLPHPFFKYYKEFCNGNSVVIYSTCFIACWILAYFAYHFIQVPIEKYLTKHATRERESRQQQFTSIHT